MPHLILMIIFQTGGEGCCRGVRVICHLIPSGSLTYYGSTLWSNHFRDKFQKPCDYLRCLSKNEQACFCRVGAMQKETVSQMWQACHHRICFCFV